MREKLSKFSNLKTIFFFLGFSTLFLVLFYLFSRTNDFQDFLPSFPVSERKETLPDKSVPSPFLKVFDVPQTTESTSYNEPPPSSFEKPMERTDIQYLENAEVLDSNGEVVFQLVKELDINLDNFFSWWKPFYYYNDEKNVWVVSGYVGEINLKARTFELSVNGFLYKIHFDNTSSYWVSNISNASLEGFSDIYPLASSSDSMEKVSSGTALTAVGFSNETEKEFSSSMVYIVHYE